MEFKGSIEDYATKLLTRMDVKLERIEHQLDSIDFKTELFKFEKRLSKLEQNKFGFDLSSFNNNGDN
ncbi:hypothetical protein ES705_13482 [subsurface metagenome]